MKAQGVNPVSARGLPHCSACSALPCLHVAGFACRIPLLSLPPTDRQVGRRECWRDLLPLSGFFIPAKPALLCLSNWPLSTSFLGSCTLCAPSPGLAPAPFSQPMWYPTPLPDWNWRCLLVNHALSSVGWEIQLWEGRVAKPRGGVRGVIAGKGLQGH